jgi:hypothetical protein
MTALIDDDDDDVKPASTMVVSCDRCKCAVFYDRRQAIIGEHICRKCVEEKQQARIAELEQAKRVMATNEGRLHARLAHEQTTLTAIEYACVARGYDPESGELLADWLAAQLDRLDALRRRL